MTLPILICYVAVTDSPLLVHQAARFALTYMQHPPGCDHHVVVACNGGPLSPKNRAMFTGVPCEFYPRANDGGWDISAYQDVCADFKADLMVCLGASVYFHRTDWLARLVDCWSKHGAGMYGCFSSYLVRPHLNTTAFVVDSNFLMDYPAVTNKKQRYDFEHGPKSMWRRIAAQGGATRLVTWDGCWEPKDWRKPENILWKGTQENLLMRCNHTDKFDGATDEVKRKWSKGADTLCV